MDFAYDDPKVEFNVDAPNGVVMEGYLFKRASNAFKTWNRRWFSIQNSQLVYQKKLKASVPHVPHVPHDSLTVVVEDLRLCSVKPCEDIERRFCFEVVSPSKSCMLQAESEKLRQAWIQAVQASIASAYRESPDSYYTERLDRTASPSTSSIDSASEPRERSVRAESVLQRVQCVPGNDMCCDCGQADPRWASINLGILLCIECSGIHRSLGVHCSKVRSLTLDSWEPELLKLMCELGNSVINHIYEGACEEQGMKKPGANSPRQEKEAWIRAKYVEKKFLKKMATAEALANSERKTERRWAAKKCRRHNSATTVHKHRRKYRQDPSSGSLCSATSALGRKFRRDSLFCPDELDSLFSYFDTSAGPRSLSSDSGLGGSSDGSTDVLLFGSVVDSVTEEECEVSEDSSGEVELEPEASDPEDVRELHPGALLYKACQARNLPVMAEALAHGADVNSTNEEDEGKSPLIQAVIGVCLFLKRGATQNDGDDDGQDPLSIAVQAANADIVTLLRLARMNEEMRESEGPLGQPGDTTYLDIFREFSHMASHNPEKLKRRSIHFRHSFRHYLVRGPEKTPYEGGYYHGKLIFPREFPFKPPSIYMITPNGRFKCNTRLCLSITDFHPDTWNPAWSVSTILTGLLSFMVEKGPTLGSIETSDFTKRQLASQSLAFNIKDKVFCELFPDVVDEIKQKQQSQEELSSRSQTLPLPDVVLDSEAQNGRPAQNGHAPPPELQQGNRNHGLLGGALANLFVIVGFAAFAYTVKYVLRSIAQE
ncbi:hypothetical protein QTP70_008908 [Hemibagrus guttatus]|uniref:Arf-GAP with coiled-coil, ANK repeat and PH domain-containing protein n=1 Tax=Hemibagrus guttatus TaxID=175788 RepID=A0AAE0QEV5_9TELE|nr:hypothetical protein QTP70_008908 [Hemibagrus guttatus]